MIIFDNENEKNIVLGILGIVANNTNLYWHDENDIDYDKQEYTEYLKLKNELQNKIGKNNDTDIMSVLYKFLDY